jgi:hypothetical protein
LYSDIKIRIKLRDINQLLYIEPGGELAKPVKIKCQMLGNYIYLSDEERKTNAITKTENIIERFSYGGTLVRSWSDLKQNLITELGITKNILKLRYYYNDPCKFQALDPGESLYSFCLFPGLLQPSGTTNFTEIDNLTFYMEINEYVANLMRTAGIKLRIMMWECSYNIFVAMSGFGALRFYSSFTFN